MASDATWLMLLKRIILCRQPSWISRKIPRWILQKVFRPQSYIFYSPDWHLISAENLLCFKKFKLSLLLAIRGQSPLTDPIYLPHTPKCADSLPTLTPLTSPHPQVHGRTINISYNKISYKHIWVTGLCLIKVSYLQIIDLSLGSILLYTWYHLWIVFKCEEIHDGRINQIDNKSSLLASDIHVLDSFCCLYRVKSTRLASMATWFLVIRDYLHNIILTAYAKRQTCTSHIYSEYRYNDITSGMCFYLITI